MSERSKNSIFLTKLRQMEKEESEKSQNSNLSILQKKKAPNKTYLNKNSNSSILKKVSKNEIRRPKSRLQTKHYDKPGESAFPVLHTTSAAPVKINEDLEPELLPTYYNTINKQEQKSLEKEEDSFTPDIYHIKEDNSMKEEDIDKPSNNISFIDLSSNETSIIEESKPIKEVNTKNSINKEDKQRYEENEVCRDYGQQKHRENEQDIYRDEQIYKEEDQPTYEDYQMYREYLQKYDDEKIPKEQEQVEERESSIVIPSGFNSKPMSREDSCLISSEQTPFSNMLSPIKVQITEPSSVSLSLPLSAIPNDISSDATSDEFIPPRLLEIIDLDRTSITYLALAGLPVNGYSAKRLSNAINELNIYLEYCIYRGFVSEASYVENALSVVKDAYEESKQMADLTPIYNLEDRISSIDTEMTQKTMFFKNQKVLHETERDIKLKSLKYKLNEDLNEIDRVWTSKEQTKKYNRTSSKLRTLQREAETLLKAKRFNEAEIVALQVDKLTKIETKQAIKKMQEDYKKAVKKREKKYKSDREAVISFYKSREDELSKKKSKIDTVLQRRHDKLVIKKNNMEQKMNIGVLKRNVQSSESGRSSSTIMTQRKKRFNDLKDPHAGLALKPLKKVKKVRPISVLY